MDLTFDIVTDPHPLLDDAVVAIDDTDKLEALNGAAERMLGLRGRQLSGDDTDTARVAIAYQMNYMIEMGTTGFAVQAEKRGERSTTYRGATARGVAPIAPLAEETLRSIAALSDAAWGGGVQSLRSSGCRTRNVWGY